MLSPKGLMSTVGLAVCENWYAKVWRSVDLAVSGRGSPHAAGVGQDFSSISAWMGSILGAGRPGDLRH